MEVMVEVEQAVAVEERGRGGCAEEVLEVRRGRRRRHQGRHWRHRTRWCGEMEVPETEALLLQGRVG